MFVSPTVCLSVPNCGVAYLVDLSYSNLDFYVFEIFEDFSMGYFFCLAQFWFFGPREGKKGKILKFNRFDKNFALFCHRRQILLRLKPVWWRQIEIMEL